MISLNEPILGEQEKAALSAVIEGGWLTMGDRVAAFERAFAEVHGASGAVAVSSCTAGLHLCLAALKIGPGDEVLVPSVTFVATVNAVLYLGARPVFVDIENGYLPHMSLADAEAKCTSKTKAVIVMHYGGYLVDIRAWRAFADARGLVLVEDAAHAPGARDVGQWSHAAAFSFFSNKNMTTAEGGMVLAADGSLLEDIRLMRAHGMSTGTLDRHRGHAHSYDVTALGYNYRLDELRAAIGLVQLTHLDEWNRRRRQLTDYYRKCISKNIPAITIPFEAEHETAAHIMPILLPEDTCREEVMSKLRHANVQTSIHYPLVHQFSYYRSRFPGVRLPNSEAFASHELTLPLYPSLTESDLNQVVEALCVAIH